MIHRFFFKVIPIGAFIFAAWTCFAAGQVGYVAEGLEAPTDVASALLLANRQVPSLLSENLGLWGAELWDIIREQVALVKLYKASPRYKDIYRDRTSLHRLTIRSPQRPSLHGYDLGRFLQRVEAVVAQYPDKATLDAGIARALAARGQKKSQDLLTRLISSMGPELRKEYRGQIGDIDQLAQFYSSHGGVPSRFEPSLFGLPAEPSVQAVLDRYSEMKSAEEKLENLRLARFYLENRAVFDAGTEGEALRILNGAEGGELKNLLPQFRSAVQVSGPEIDLTLKEQTAFMALFRGCVGFECSTRDAARYATLPSERTYYIYDARSPDHPKGTLNAALVKDESGRKMLLLKGINGVRISREEVSAILAKAQEIAVAQGAEGVLMPGKVSTNYTQVARAFDDFTKGPRIGIQVLDRSLRKLLDPSGRHHAEALSGYDYAYGYKNADPEAASLSAASSFAPIETMKLPEMTPMDRFEAGLAFAFLSTYESSEETFSPHYASQKEFDGGRRKVFRDLGLRAQDIDAIVRAFQSPSRFTEEEFKQEILKHARTRSGSLDSQETLRRLNYLIDENRMRFKEAFLPENERRSLHLLMNSIRGNYDTDIHKFAGYIYVKGRPVPLLKEKILGLLRAAEKPSSFKLVNILIQQLQPGHLRGGYGKLLAEEFLKKKDLLRSFSSSELTQSGYHVAVDQLLPYAPGEIQAMVAELEQPDQLDYYLDFSRETRAALPGFDRAVLSDLREGHGHRWWLGDFVSVDELGEILKRNGVAPVERLERAASKGNVAVVRCAARMLRAIPKH